MKFTISQVMAAVFAVAKLMVPLRYRWALALLADVFAQKSATMPPTAAAEAVTVAAPQELKDIIAALFDQLNAFVANRPFILAVIKALEAYILNNLIDAIFDQLTNGGARVASGAALVNHHPPHDTALHAELDAAVALD